MILGVPVYRDYRIVHSTDEKYMTFMHGYADSKPVPQSHHLRPQGEFKLKYEHYAGKNSSINTYFVSIMLGLFVGAIPATLSILILIIIRN